MPPCDGVVILDPIHPEPECISPTAFNVVIAVPVVAARPYGVAVERMVVLKIRAEPEVIPCDFAVAHVSVKPIKYFQRKAIVTLLRDGRDLVVTAPSSKCPTLRGCVD